MAPRNARSSPTSLDRAHADPAAAEVSWSACARRMDRLLRALSFRDARGRELGADAGFARWRTLTMEVRAQRRCIYLVGNGASAAMASHFAADLAKNGRIHTEVFSDLSLITAISNDLGYEHVFAEPLRRRAHPGDMLVAISSSGGSPNILAAAQVARDRSMAIITVTAMREDNPLRQAGTLNAWLPADRYGDAESCHAVVLHAWMDCVELPSLTSANPAVEQNRTSETSPAPATAGSPRRGRTVRTLRVPSS